MSEPNEYKIVLALPTSNDPPDAPIATWDNMIGINPPYAITKDMATPYDYGAVGDGVTDDTVAMQAWLDAIAGTAGFAQTGTYMVSSKLVIKSNTTIYGAGWGSCTITISSDFPAATQLLTNEHIVATGIKQDSNIAIYNVCFQGSSTQETSVEMVGFAGVEGLTLRGVRFQHWRRFLTTFQNVNNAVIDTCEFNDWGSLTVVPAPGSCLYDGGYAIWLGAYDTNFRITNNYIREGQWTAILLGEEGTVTNNQIIIDNNIFLNAQEAFIFGGANSCSITNNKFIGLLRKDCSGQGMELGGLYEATISGNQFFNIASSALYLFNSRVVNIFGNTFAHCNLLATPGVGDGGAAMTLNNYQIGAGPGQFAYGMDRISIHGNTFENAGLTSSHGLAFVDGGGGVMTNIDVRGNNFAPEAQWLEEVINWDDSTVRGTGFMVGVNNGAPAADISSITVSFVIPDTTTGPFTVAGIGFKPSRIELHAVSASASVLMASFGRQGWGYVWDVTTSTITAARAYLYANGIGISADGSNGRGTSTDGTFSIAIYEPDGTAVCEGYVSEVNADGFTITLDAATTEDVVVTATCYA